MARKVKKVAVPKRILRLLERMHRGERLTRQLRPWRENVASDPIFRLEPSGREVATKTAYAAIGGGFVTPAGDGLFGAESTQTYLLPTKGPMHDAASAGAI